MSAPAPTRIDLAFIQARSEGRPALVGYLPAGFPSVTTAGPMLRGLARHMDMIEIGIPRVEPMSTPLHRMAARTALHAGATPAVAFDLIRYVTALAPGTPVLLNPPRPLISRIGEQAFAAALAAAGAAGVVLPDLHPENAAARRWNAAAASHDLATLYVAHDHLAAAARNSAGAVYLPGVTRASRNIDPRHLARRRGQVRRYAGPALPVLVGQGITNPQQAVALAPYADGLAIGSVLISAAQDAPNAETAVAAITHSAGRFSAALRSHRRIRTARAA